MTPASLDSEAIRAEAALQVTRERHAAHDYAAHDLATRDHVARHYRAIALPALAAATQRVATLRANRNSPARQQG